MDADLYRIEHSDIEFTRSGEIRHIKEIRHTGLSTYRIIKDEDIICLINKVSEQFRKWDLQWEAIKKTETAQKELSKIDNILHYTLDIDDAIDWNTLQDKTEFVIPNPMKYLDQELQKLPTPQAPVYYENPEKPNIKDYKPKISLLDILTGRRKKKRHKAKLEFQRTLKNWEEICLDVKKSNEKRKKLFENELSVQKEKIKENHKKQEEKWKKQKEDFYKNQSDYNKEISALRERYLNKETSAISKYCTLVLNNSTYPKNFPQNFELEFNPDDKFLIIEYQLPSPEELPKLKEVKYIASRNELKDYFLSDTQFSAMYDKAIYEICLRTIHEIFEADVINKIDTIVFNGYVNSINKATGKEFNRCIISLQTNKKEFLEINLELIEPKACFKNLKGVGSPKLINIVAIQPIAQVKKEDKRFISSYNVTDTFDDSYNLALMDWEDFEHLVREIFEKEFSQNGGEVKVTQSSRDGGVDAIAFDPDPIRGGKIVIQAKRYTNVVGVSAVRDLYGTLMNEGAIKGILVTTSNYGPDAYKFASDKPITLLNGGNLLHLLEKHGHNVKIDLTEAKKINKSKN